jgi:hypothetical protein
VSEGCALSLSLSPTSTPHPPPPCGGSMRLSSHVSFNHSRCLLPVLQRQTNERDNQQTTNATTRQRALHIINHSLAYSCVLLLTYSGLAAQPAARFIAEHTAHSQLARVPLPRIEKKSRRGIRFMGGTASCAAPARAGRSQARHQACQRAKAGRYAGEPSVPAMSGLRIGSTSSRTSA